MRYSGDPYLGIGEYLVRSMTDKDVLLSPSHPEASIKHIMRGIARAGLKTVPPKASISLRVDQDVLTWFKSQGNGYQTRIDAVLRAFRDAAENQT